MIQTASVSHLILMILGLIALEIFILFIALHGPELRDSDDGLGCFIYLIYIGVPTLLIFKTLWGIFEELIYRLSGFYLSEISNFSILVIIVLFLFCGTVAFMYYWVKDIIKEIQTKAYKDAVKDIVSFLFTTSCFIAHCFFSYLIGEDYLSSVIILALFSLLMGWFLYTILGVILSATIKDRIKIFLDNSFLVLIETALWIFFITAFICFIIITAGGYLISVDL